MRRGLVTAALGVCALAMIPSAARAGEAGAEAVDASWAKAVRAGDVEAIVKCYAPDAVLWLPGALEARGEKAIHEAYAGLLSDNTVTDVSFTDTVYETSQNLSVGWGHFALTLQPKAGGAPVVMRGRYTDVATRLKGRWVYVADHPSADPPPAPAVKP